MLQVGDATEQGRTNMKVPAGVTFTGKNWRPTMIKVFCGDGKNWKMAKA